MKKLVILFCCLFFLVGCSNSTHIISPSKQETDLIESAPHNETDGNDSAITEIIETIPYMPDNLPSYEDLYKVSEVLPNTDWTPVDNISIDDSLLLEEKYGNIPPVTNDTPLDIMISEFKDVFFAWGAISDLRNFYPSDVNNPKLKDVLLNEDCGLIGYMPINFLRKTSDNGYYTVLKLNNGGYLYYIFAPDSIDVENVYYWGGIYSENRVSYSDFSEIKIGDSISKVISVDSSARMALVEHKYHQEVLSTVNFEPFAQVFLLTDGILEITYELADMSTEAHPEFGEEYQIIPMTRDELVVADIKYFPDSIYSSTKCIENHGVEQNLHINILPQDYPPAS